MAKLFYFVPIILLLFCEVFKLCQSEHCKIYTVVGTKTIRPNSYYNVSISLAKDTCKLPDAQNLPPGLFTPSQFQLMVTCFNVTFRKTVLLVEGHTATVPIQIKDISEDVHQCDLSVVAENYKESDTIRVIRKVKNILLIQTDKPIYKPGETVRFRLVPLTQHFQTPTGVQKVNLTIYDASHNVIKIWRNEEIKGGLLSTHLLLTSEPNLGNWKIVAKQGDFITERIFKVDQYVLPKFKVDLNLPSYVTMESPQLVAEVRAFYTHGGPVNGFCSVEIFSEPGHMKRTMEFKNGVARVEFNILEDIKPADYKHDYFLFVSATENATGIAHNTTGKIRMYRDSYKIVKNPDSNNDRLNCSFKITTPGDEPIQDPNPKAVNITPKVYDHTSDSTMTKYTYFSSVPPGGIINVRVNDTVNEVAITYKKVHFVTPINRPFHRTYGSRLSVKLTSKAPKVEELMKLHVHSVEPLTAFSYMFLSHGEIVEFQSFDSLPNVTDFGFQATIPAKTAEPEVAFIVYCITKNGEIIADSITVEFANVPLTNFLDVSLAENQVEPGANVTIQFKSKSNSTIAIKAIDQSVLLLKDEKDVTEEMLKKEFYKLNIHSERESNGYYGEFRHFKKTGLIVLTNGILKKDPVPPPRYWPQPVPELVKLGVSSGIQSPSLQKPIHLRKHFPETWLWEEIIGNGNETTITRTVPDTLTSWMITGFAVNPDSGIGLNLLPKTLKTFRPFFVSLNLPYSIVKDEIFGLQVLIHNYLPDPEYNDTAIASITLENKDSEFEFVEDGYKERKIVTKDVELKSGEVSSVTFAIVPVKFGIIKLDLKAVVSTGLAGDAVSRSLIVKPPGRKEIRNQAVLLDLKTQGQVEKLTLQAEFPKSRLVGADAIKLAIVGDVMGAAVSNLDELIQLPTGCGEQNMLKFVPDIVILDYLQELGDLTEEIKSKALTFLELGYQRELTYRHDDGSFSAFGKSDKSGSTWLTAFVVKSFAAASKYITIDEAVVLKGVQFLLSKQELEEGGFEEDGRILHIDLQGGTYGSSLTSYVALSLIEVSKVYPHLLEQNNSAITRSINLGFDFILSSDKRVRSPYSLNLAAYAFNLADHPQKDKFFKALERTAKTENGLKYWERIEDGGTSGGKTKSDSVEMTSYALLTYLLRDRLAESVSIGKWLLNQRNPNGGFISTQDTVVGLTSLAKFALATPTTSLNSNLKIKAKYDGHTQNIEVNQDNKHILQEFILPEGSSGIVEFEGEGNGAVLLQLSWSYYVEEESNSTFDLKVEVVKGDNEGILPLKICTTYTRTIPSNMAVTEIHLPSGHSFDPEVIASELAAYERVKRHELENSNTKLNVYFDKFKRDTTCMVITASRDYIVANLVKSAVLVYDYYNSHNSAIAFYDPPKFSVCDVCNNEISRCKVDVNSC